MENVSTAVGPRNMPEAIRCLSPMGRHDYADLFTLTTAGADNRSAQQWARALFEDAAGLQGQLLWRVLLGLRLKSRRATGHVAGWRIAGRGDGWVRLAADSWFMTAHLIVRVGADHVSLATLIRYDRPVAEWIWVPMSKKHRQVAPGLLHEALERLRELEDV